MVLTRRVRGEEEEEQEKQEKEEQEEGDIWFGSRLGDRAGDIV